MKKFYLTMILFVLILFSYGQTIDFDPNDQSQIGKQLNEKSLLGNIENNGFQKGAAFLPIYSEEASPQLIENASFEKNATTQQLDSIYYWIKNTQIPQLSLGGKSVNTYNTNNELINVNHFSGDGTIWMNSVKDTYAWDSNHNKVSLLYQDWINSDWQNRQRDDYSYDSNGNMIICAIQHWSNGNWHNSIKLDYTYDSNNNMVSELWSNYITPDNQWRSVSKKDYTYGPFNKLKSTLASVASDGLNWQADYSINYTYDTSNNNLANELTSIWDGTNWVLYYLKKYSYDSNNNISSWTQTHWIGGQVDTHETKDNYTYNADNLMESEEYNQWQGNSEITYKNYYYYHNNQSSIYDPNDVAALKTIRDKAPADSPLKTEWTDENQIRTWDGVDWDNSTPKRVTDLNFDSKKLTTLNVSGLTNLQTLWCPFNQLTSLDLSGLANLEALECIGNQLTSLNVSGLTKLNFIRCENNQLTSLDISSLTSLATLNCSNNNIPFSQMPLPNPTYVTYTYSPQNTIFEALEISAGQEIDYSSEATIGGSATVFSWYKDGILLTGTDQTGKYMSTVVGDYYCEMTNARFPGLTLTTNTITVKNGTPVATLKLVSKLNTDVIPSSELNYQLYLKNGNSFSIVNPFPVEAGDTTFVPVPSGEYIVLTTPFQTSLTFIPTYVGNVLDWNTAEHIVIPDKGTVIKEVNCIQPAAMGSGNGQISGSINETNTVSTKSISIISSTYDNGNPIEGALVQLFKKGESIPIASILTDSNGYYKFDQLEITDYEIAVEIPGFIQSERFVVTVSESQPSVSLKLGVNTSSQTITGVNSNLSSLFKIYPNPSSGKVTISSSENLKSLNIYDLQGRLLFSKIEINQLTNTDLDLLNYNKGIYVVKIQSESHDYTEKLVIR